MPEAKSSSTSPPRSPRAEDPHPAPAIRPTPALVAMLLSGMLLPSCASAFTSSVSNQTVTGEVVENGSQSIGSNGVAYDSIVRDVGIQFVNSGGTTHGGRIEAGGEQRLQDGGAAHGIRIEEGGIQKVQGDGLTHGSIVNAGGVQRVFFTGVSHGTQVNAGGLQIVDVFAQANATVVNAEGEQEVRGNAVANASILQAGGRQTVQAYATANDTLIEGGEQQVYGTANGSVIGDAGRQDVYSGGRVNGTLISGKGAGQWVTGNAVADDTQVSGERSRQLLYGNAVANRSQVVGTGALQFLQNNSTANDTIIGDGGLQELGLSPGWSHQGNTTANRTQVKAGGAQYVHAGNTANATLVEANGLLQVTRDGTARDVDQRTDAILVLETQSTVTGSNSLGTFSIDNGLARDVLLENGSRLLVLTGHGAEDTSVRQSSLSVEEGAWLGGITRLDEAELLLQGEGLSASSSGELQVNGSRFEGRINASDLAVQLDSSSHWSVSGDSHVGALRNDGTVEFAGTPQPTTLTVEGDLEGQGRFAMRSNLAMAEGDLLQVLGQTHGSHTLMVEDSGLEPASADALRLVDGNGGDGAFALLGGHVDAGAFRYTLQKAGDDWVLAAPVTPEPEVPTPTDPDPGIPTDPPPPIDPLPNDLSTGANAAIASHTANAGLWEAQLAALSQRLGELRLGRDQGGVWVRGISQRNELGKLSSRAFEQGIQGVEVGADKAFTLDNGQIYLGGLFGTAQSELNLDEGASAQTRSTFAGLYATYLNGGGWYLDGQLQYARFDTDLRTPTNLGRPVKADYASNGLGARVEAGKRLALSSTWFAEPHLALSASRTQGASYRASNGLQARSDDLDSLQSRAGVLLGRTGERLQPYLKAALVNEHAGHGTLRINGHRLRSELPGSRLEAGFGAVARLGERGTLSLDLAYAKGEDIERPLGLNLGYSHNW